ncbi:MAG: MFS transporter [Gammaproteobacteria bacterium]|nr:MFS transporter [Gammaproteobacteria bacterium]
MDRPVTTGYRAYVMFVLVLVYTFNFIDRQIVGILAVPIKADLGLTDTELGLMGGLAFALFYTALGIPVAMLADRWNRTWIMTIALTVWSAMTAVCGLAQNFWQLFLARLGVGIGEAGGVAPAYSLISDYFPSNQRARALSVYSFGIPIGSALGILFGGYIASRIDWRYAFFAVGLAGIVVAPLFKLTVAEPRRGQFDRAETKGPSPTIRQIFGTLATKRSFWTMSVGAAASSMMGYGLFFWLPSFFVRSFGFSLLDASLFYGGILLVGGIAGTWLGGFLADRLGQRNRAAYVLVPAVAFVLTIPFFVVAITASTLVVTFFAMLVPTALGLAWLGPVISAMQHIVPPQMRATTSAIFLFINNLIGIGAGTVAIGMISDGLQARFGDDSLKYAILSGSVFYLVAAILLLVSARHIGRDWEE